MLPDYLSLHALDALILHALAEDIGDGDVTTLATIPEEATATAHFLAKADGTLAGLKVAERVFAHLEGEVTVRWKAHDGEHVTAGTTFGTAEGNARALLTGERLALNLLQRMSGIATATRAMVDAVHPRTTSILDTRKTAPGLRLLDKWAVRLGGGANHRIGLFDRVLIKDNHITAAGGVVEAIEAARVFLRQEERELPIQIEARTLEEVDTVVAEGGVDWILLDNMVRVDGDDIDTSMLAEAVHRVGGRVKTEASGNVTLATVAAIAETGVDAISSGALTHSVTAMDISLKIRL